MSRHRSGEGYQNISLPLKVHKNTVASSILKLKKFVLTLKGLNTYLNLIFQFFVFNTFLYLFFLCNHCDILCRLIREKNM